MSNVKDESVPILAIVPSSPESKQLTKGARLNKFKVEFPFEKLEVDQSFLVPFNLTTGPYIRNLASNIGRKSKPAKTFRVIKHPAHEIYEVARIA